MSDKNPAVGIDLGTTNTVVSVQTDSTGPVVLEIPQPINERKHFEFSPHIKSAVFFESADSVAVGAFANNRMDSLRSIKSHMGTRWQTKNPLTDKFISPSFISAHILNLALQTILRKFPKWDRTALITVPASFNTDQRNDTISAAEMAGFKNVRLLDEPTAAFYYFFNQNRESGDFDNDQHILIFDFGGGTLDVSIIFVTHNGDEFLLDAIGRSRYNNLGGDDIDLDIATFLLGCWEFEQNIEVTELNKEIKEKLYKLFIDKSRNFKEEAEDYIKFDSDMPEFFINEDLHSTNHKLHIDFKRKLDQSQYENIASKYLQAKSDLNIYRPLEEALTVANNIDSEFTRDKLNLILYTGGTSSMLSVQRAIQSYFAGKHCFSIDEEEACNTVALGAAACRYDELYGKKHVKMSNRLLESIFTRLPKTRNYKILVPLTCEPSKGFIKIEGEYSLNRPTIKFKLPLFRGVDTHDHQLSPIRDLIIPLDRVLYENTPYEIFYRMTNNKTIELKVIFKDKSGPIEKIASLNLIDTNSGSGPIIHQKLYRINPV